MVNESGYQNRTMAVIDPPGIQTSVGGEGGLSS
jgi:hypothetical protein